MRFSSLVLAFAPGSALAMAIGPVSPATSELETRAATSLNAGFKAKGKLYFGTEIDHYHLSNTGVMNIAKAQFGQVTCENSMKWDAIEREWPCRGGSFGGKANTS